MPECLRRLRRWIPWALQPSPGGRPTKRPLASTTDPAAWRTWPEVVAERPPRADQGPGLVLTGSIEGRLRGEPLWLVPLDVDACCWEEDGKLQLSESAQRILAIYPKAHVERTPSGYGLRVFIWVRRLPKAAEVQSKIRLPETAPPGCTKRPELQLFGLGPAQYITVSGAALNGSTDIGVYDSLDPLIEAFGLKESPLLRPIQLPTAEGTAPELQEIDRRVRKHKKGARLADGHWQETHPGRTASDAFWMLAHLALDAAEGHGETAVDYIMQCTAWGRGEVHDSKDPAKYTKRTWVVRDLSKAWATSAPRSPSEVFAPLDPEDDDEVPAGADASDIDRVLDGWTKDGPLVHLPTSLAALDAATGGGLVLGSRVYVVGAPDAGKTLLVTQIADHYARQGIAVGILAVDEEPSDIVLRLAQRRGLTRPDCEQRAADTIATARAALRGLPVRLFDGRVTIETAGKRLRKFAGTGKPAVLVLDSVQVVRCDAEDEDDSPYRSVTARVRAIRRVASEFGILVIATSEMSRAAYRTKDEQKKAADIAAAKESGAIEYDARVQFVLRSASADVIECRIGKNKHGPTTRSDEHGIYLRLDRAQQCLTEDATFAALEGEDEQDNSDDAAVIGAVLAAGEAGASVRAIRSAEIAVPRARREASVQRLLDADVLTTSGGAKRSSMHHVLRIPEHLRHLLPEAAVAAWSAGQARGLL